MIILINFMSNFFNLPDINPLFSLLLIPLAALLFFRAVNNRSYRSEQVSEAERNFRLEITGYLNESVRVELAVSDELSGEDISNILTTALPVIGKKDPRVLRLLLYHCLEAMDGDEEISKECEWES